MNKKVKNKSLNEIVLEWDAVSNKRQKIIEEGKDISLSHVTCPCIIRNLKSEKCQKVLDVGCGTGYLTNKVSAFCDLCYGIDASNESIELAKKKYSGDKTIFINTTISNLKTDLKFDACVSNMVIMTDPEWEISLKHIYEMLRPKGLFLIMMTHPCFWPSYWEYDDESWFNYDQEIYIQRDFRTSLSEKIGTTTHIHRPLSKYLNTIIETGFKVLNIEEPFPVPDTPSEYVYEKPRFLFIKCQK